MLSKRAAAKAGIEEKIHRMQCPICKEALALDTREALVCQEGHSFDISKKGYVNVLRQAPKENYEKALFESRQRLIHAGMYKGLIEKMRDMIEGRFASEKGGYLLDAGCGEGSHLCQLKTLLGDPWACFGLDIAKAGVALATDHRQDITWLVGDLAQLPIQNEGLEVILNILSPGHYETFKRVLKPEGVILKVIPTADYLKEIRQALFPGETYDNTRVMKHFEEHFDVIESQRVSYRFDVAPDLKADLLRMTPLTWQVSPETLEALDINSITVSLVIMVGRVK